MGRADRERQFTDFARSRTSALHRSAWLLCRDEHEAHDLVQETLTKVYVAWMKPLARIDNPVAYAHTTLTRTFLSSRRKRSSTETPLETFPDVATTDGSLAADLRLVTADALARPSDLDRVKDEEFTAQGYGARTLAHCRALHEDGHDYRRGTCRRGPDGTAWVSYRLSMGPETGDPLTWEVHGAVVYQPDEWVLGIEQRTGGGHGEPPYMEKMASPEELYRMLRDGEWFR